MDWKDAKIGHLYYRVGYSDPEMRNPHVDPVVYLGTDVAGERPDGPCHYYQDVDSFLGRGAFPMMASLPNGEEDCSFVIEAQADDPCELKSAEEVGAELAQCSHRWPAHEPQK